MIGGIMDALMGKVDYQATAKRLDTKPGQRAIQTQAQLGGEQALAQAYSLAASGRSGGAGGALAMREAQRRGAEATMNLQGQSVAQQQALQQSALQAQNQAEMQAQQINAGIAQNNAQGFQKLAGTALMAGAMMSDYRQKEMLSDFTSKEAPGSYLPQQMRAGVDESLLSNVAVNRHLEDRRTQMFDRDQGQIAAAAEQGPSALQTLGVTPEQGAEATAMRDAGRIHNEGAALQTDLDDRRARAAALFGPSKTERNLGMLGEYLMTSDARAKEKAYAAGVAAGSQRSPMTPGYGPPLRPPPMAPGYGGSRAPMISDFQQKETLDPVQPTLYRYNPESSYRQALEAAQRTFATTIEDKRAPRMGIVAQDLQQSSAFAPSVVQKDDGQLAVDKDRALSAALAELGGLHQRVKKLEGGKRRGA